MALLGRMTREQAESLHGEVAADNFSCIDTDVSFYSFVRGALLRYRPAKVLDFGAGRNGYVQDFDPEVNSFLIRELRDLRATGAHVTAADVSEAVLTHPTSDRQVVIDPRAALPFDDQEFDLVVSDYVFEHVEDPHGIARELRRVLSPGGWIIARTPNKYGYLRLASSIVPNRLHVAALKAVQPHRKAVDTFPTHYRLNSQRDLERAFPGCQVRSFSDSWEPAYFFGRLPVYRAFRVLHRLLPRRLGTATVFLIRTPTA